MSLSKYNIPLKSQTPTVQPQRNPKPGKPYTTTSSDIYLRARASRQVRARGQQGNCEALRWQLRPDCIDSCVCRACLQHCSASGGQLGQGSDWESEAENGKAPEN